MAAMAAATASSAATMSQIRPSSAPHPSSSDAASKPLRACLFRAPSGRIRFPEQKPLQIRTRARRAAAPRASSSADEEEALPLPTRKEAVRVEQASSGIDRRQLLVATSVSAAAAAGVPLFLGEAGASPIVSPNLGKCVAATVPGVQVNCCPPQPTRPVKVFTFPAPGPVRVRQPAHLVSADYVAKYNKAYELLRALPASDPRSYTQQANVHCAYCDAGYTQADGVTPLQVHNSWLFFPFHRWYLYFHERILASLLGDPSFALPFWNWDNQTVSAPLANTLPPLYVNNASLFDANRSPAHQPPTLVSFSFTPQTLTDAQTRDANNNIMYQQLVSGARTTSLFFGQAYRAGDAQPPGGGTVENVPHGVVHVWTGNENNPNSEDMGNFYSAGRDPIFFAHHANIDRLWSVWKTLPGGRRRDPTDSDWLNSEFLFYDENADLVRVRVGDAVATERLGYTYQTVPDGWKDFKPVSLSASAATPATSSRRSLLFGGEQAAMAASPAASDDLPEFGAGERKLDRNLSFKIPRPQRPVKSRSLFPEDDDEEEEVLVIEGVTVPCDRVTHFDVFLNLPDADQNTPLSAAEYVGSFYNIPHFAGGMSGMSDRQATLRLGIGDTLKDLGIEDVSNLVVTLVPRGADAQANPIVVQGFRIEYE